MVRTAFAQPDTTLIGSRWIPNGIFSRQTIARPEGEAAQRLRRYYSTHYHLDYSADQVELGMFVRSVEKILPPATPDTPLLPDHEDEDEVHEPGPEPVKVLEGNSTFDHMIVWGHDTLPAADDPFVKGVEEWIAFAEAVSLLYL